MGNTEPQGRAAKWNDWHATVGALSDQWRSPLTLLSSTGYSTRAKEKGAFRANLNIFDMVTWSSNKSPPGKAGAVQFKSGTDIRIIRVLSGHSNLSTESRYTHSAATTISRTLQSIRPPDAEGGAAELSASCALRTGGGEYFPQPWSCVSFCP
jgi:hypothetical protein